MKVLESFLSPLTSYWDSQPPTGPILSLHNVEATPPPPHPISAPPNQGNSFYEMACASYQRSLLKNYWEYCLLKCPVTVHSDICTTHYKQWRKKNRSSSEGSFKINWNTEKATWCQKFRAIEKFISTHLERNCPFQKTLTGTLCSMPVIFEAEQHFLVSFKDLSLYPWSSSLFFSS